MSTGSTDALIRLIQSLSKAEKRNFKLYATRNSSGSEELKFLRLFDWIEKSDHYSDELVLKKLPEIKKAQLSNVKAHLYKQVLGSLRLQHVTHIPSLEIRETIDHAELLHHRGFYMQALKQLEKAKALAQKYESQLLLLEIVELEKNIESHYITRSLGSRAEMLTRESSDVHKHVSLNVAFSNLGLQLYALYVKVGFVRDQKDFDFVTAFFESRLPHYKLSELGFEEKIQLCNAQIWYHFITQDFLSCFKYARLWVDCFQENAGAKEQYNDMYLKGLYHLQNAVFNLRSVKRLEAVIELIAKEEGKVTSENAELLRKLYWITGRINGYYLKGTFSEGVKFVVEVERFIDQYRTQLDIHRIMILYYKMGCLHFGNGDNKQAIRYLNQVISMKEVSLREDIQCFARILNLIAHFELGNDDLVDYQMKSVYRFLKQMGDLHGVQQEILKFLRQPAFVNEAARIRGFKQLHAKLVKLSHDPFEKRPFLYLDIISWLECKIDGIPIQEVIRRKFNQEQITGESQYFPKETR